MCVVSVAGFLLRAIGMSGHAGQRVAARIERQLPSRWASRGKQIITVDGVTWRLDLSDNLQRTLFLTGHYEPDYGSYLCSQLTSGDVFLDVGANIGVHSIAAARKVAPLGFVFAFEPAPDAAELLEEAAASAHVAVRVERIALGAANETRFLRARGDFNVADKSVRSLYGQIGRGLEVEVITLDDWIDRRSLEAV